MLALSYHRQLEVTGYADPHPDTHPTHTDPDARSAHAHADTHPDAYTPDAYRDGYPDTYAPDAYFDAHPDAHANSHSDAHTPDAYLNTYPDTLTGVRLAATDCRWVRSRPHPSAV